MSERGWFIKYPFLRAVFLFIRCWVIAIVALAALYFGWLRDYQMNWGANAEDVKRVMPGDELQENPDFNATRVVEIKAPPEKIWPWIVQMGYKRAGFYSFDRLDNAGIPSSDTIMPDYQDIKVGDTISLGGASVLVAEMEPYKSMLWIFTVRSGPWAGATWSWGLYPVDNERTRLVSRLRMNYTLYGSMDIIMCGLLDAFEVIMMRTSILGIRHRVESGQNILARQD
jgi:hypothetical protein